MLVSCRLGRGRKEISMLKKTTITPEDMKDLAEKQEKTSSDADIFLTVRFIQQQGRDNNIYFTNLGHLYWFLMKDRNRKMAG